MKGSLPFGQGSFLTVTLNRNDVICGRSGTCILDQSVIDAVIVDSIFGNTTAYIIRNWLYFLRGVAHGDEVESLLDDLSAPMTSSTVQQDEFARHVGDHVIHAAFGKGCRRFRNTSEWH